MRLNPLEHSGQTNGRRFVSEDAVSREKADGEGWEQAYARRGVAIHGPGGGMSSGKDHIRSERDRRDARRPLS
jgi:hypothetical protein